MYTWFKDVENALSILTSSDGYGKSVIFDADGTLWPDDLGEAFFQHQIQHQLTPALKEMKNAWEQYMELDKASTADANAWIVKLNAGMQIGVLREQAKKFYKDNFQSQLNPLIKDLIEKLQKQNYQVWVCSASMKWAIEPALYDLDIPLENLIGTECKVDSKGMLTKEIITPLPYASGKKDALKLKLNAAPFCVVGNSYGDMAMLNWATDLPLVIQYQPGMPSLAGSERSLRHEAETKGWLIQIFNRS